jgi:hypothetical protein
MGSKIRNVTRNGFAGVGIKYYTIRHRVVNVGFLSLFDRYIVVYILAVV